MKHVKGSCHCSNIKFDLMWPNDTDVIATRECGCAFCKKHGGAWTSNTDARLQIAIATMANVSEYQFGTKTAAFYVCNSCGVVPFVISNIEDILYAVVNANTFDERARYTFTTAATDFDGESNEDRLARRKKNWINRVEISVESA